MTRWRHTLFTDIITLRHADIHTPDMPYYYAAFHYAAERHATLMRGGAQSAIFPPWRYAAMRYTHLELHTYTFSTHYAIRHIFHYWWHTSHILVTASHLRHIDTTAPLLHITPLISIGHAFRRRYYRWSTLRWYAEIYWCHSFECRYAAASTYYTATLLALAAMLIWSSDGDMAIVVIMILPPPPPPPPAPLLVTKMVAAKIIHTLRYVGRERQAGSPPPPSPLRRRLLRWCWSRDITPALLLICCDDDAITLMILISEMIEEFDYAIYATLLRCWAAARYADDVIAIRVAIIETCYSVGCCLLVMPAIIITGRLVTPIWYYATLRIHEALSLRHYILRHDDATPYYWLQVGCYASRRVPAHVALPSLLLLLICWYYYARYWLILRFFATWYTLLLLWW